MTDDITNAARAIAGVSSVQTDGDRTLSVLCTDDAKIDVLHAVEDAGGVVSDFDPEETSLEEMFAAYTVDSESEAPMETDPMSPVGDDAKVDA